MRLILLALFCSALVGCHRESADGEPGIATSIPTISTPAATSPTTPAFDASTPVPGTVSVDYSTDAHWICRPEKQGTPCDGSLDQAVLSSDGSVKLVKAGVAANPPIDCFYVYPTVSTDPGVNSDLDPGIAETSTVVAQAAPFGQVCRLFVPVYRQLTVTALTTGRFSDPTGVATAYGDVVAAWEYYLQHDNHGRGFVLIGHSQGAMVLKRLIAEHIDGDARVRSHLVSAILAGTAVSVPSGKDVGGDFANIPACRTTTQTGCVVTYSTFNAVSPPPPLSLFGRVAGLNNQVVCVNPAGPGREQTGELSFWLAASSFRNFATSGAAAAVRPDSGYGVAEGLIDAKCVTNGQFTYLEVHLNAAGSALGLNLPRFLTGEVWGLHILDMSLPMGNLVQLVRMESSH
ncbi:MAG: DUF3089 domain-containing protein [bacterium]